MKKRFLSLMLCLTMVVTMLTGITIQVSAANDDGLTPIDTEFYDDSTGTATALTSVPDGWTLTGNGYTWRANGLGPGYIKSVGETKIYKNDSFDTKGAEYTFSVNLSHYNENFWIHFGASTLADAYAHGAGTSGYCFKTAMSGDGRKGVYTLYKNGTPIENLTLTDSGSNYNYQKNVRTFSFTVTSTGIVVTGPFTGSPITIADASPITQGYVGASLAANTSKATYLSYCNLNSIKLFHAPSITTNAISNSMSVNEPEAIRIATNGKLDSTTVNTTNAYLRKKGSTTALTAGYTVALDSTGKTIVFTPVATNGLNYKTDYEVVITTGIKAKNGFALKEGKVYEFRTANPDFEVLSSLYGTGTDPVVESSAGGEGIAVTPGDYTLKYSVSNTTGYNGGGNAYVIVSFENASGEVFKTVANKVNISSRAGATQYDPLKDAAGNEIAVSVNVPADATVMKSYLVTADLDSYHRADGYGDGATVLPNAKVTYTGDTVTVSGEGATANKEVYLMMMNLNNSSSAATLTPYTFDPATIAQGDEFGAKIQKFAKTDVDSNGKYSFTIPMHDVGTVATDWRFYIGGEDFSAAQTQTFYFASETMKNTVVSEINGADATAIKTILEDETKSKTLGIDDNALIDAFKAADTAAGNTVLIDALADKLDAAGAFVDTNGDASVDAFIDELNEIAVFMAIENDMRNLIVDPATGKFTDEAKAVLDFAGLDVADPTKPATVTAVFEGDELSSTAKTAVLDALMGTAYASATEVHNVFKNNVLVNAIKDDGMDITDLLNDNNEHFGINLDTYNNLNETQIADVNTALKAATLDATSTSNLAASIQTIINDKIATFDLSVYSYSFSSADAISTDWVVSCNGTYTFTDTNGFKSATYKSDGKTYTESSLYSPVGKTFEGDYILESDAARNAKSNQAVYYFNYTDSNNHCYVEFCITKGISLVRKQGGNVTFSKNLSEYTSSGYETNAQIIVEKEGYVTVKGSSGTVYFDKEPVGGELEGGRIGIHFKNVPGTVKTVTVKNLLTANNVVEEVSAVPDDMVDTELAPTFTGTFNYPVNPATVKKENVKLLASKVELDDNGKPVILPNGKYSLVPGAEISGAIDTVSLGADGVSLTVKVKEGVLDYKTDYYLRLTTGIKMALRTDGTFAADNDILFNTKAPELNITKMYDTAESGPLYFTNDMSRYREVYTRATNLAGNEQSIGTFSIPIFMKGLNTGSAKTVDIYITIEDENSTYAVTKVNDVPLVGTAAESWITPTGFSATEDTTNPLATITASSSVTADAVVKYYIVDSNNANIITAYPFVDNASVTDNGERPSFSLVVDELAVWGKTYSGSEGKTVNMIIEDDSGVAKLVASTKTTTGGRYDFSTVIDPAWFASGTYHIYIAGQDYAARVTPEDASGNEIELKYLDNTDKASLMTRVNNAIPGLPSVIETELNTYSDELGLTSLTTTGVNLYDALYTADPANITRVAEKVAARTSDFADDATTGETAYEKFIAYVREAMAVQAYDEGIASAVHGSDGTLLLDEILHFANVNNINSSTVDAYTFYTTKLNESGKAQVRNALLGGTYTEAGGTGINALYKEFIAQTIISGISDENYNGGAGYTGIGHISDLITKNANYSAANDADILTAANYTNYTGLSPANKVTVDGELQDKVENGTIYDIATLNTELATIMSPYVGSTPPSPGPSPSPSPSPSPGPSGTTSSVGIAGGSTISEVEGRMNFTDLAGYEWAEESISALAKKGVVSGDGNGIFRPGDRVKREEFMKMGLLGTNIGINNYVTSSFKDADKDHWAYKIIATAENRGITTGRPDGTFGFGENITREEVATLMYRILSSLGKTSVVSSNVLDGFKDKGDVSDYAVQAISFMVNNGIINGVEADVLAPKDYCTRAQVAKMVYGVMNLLN